MPTETLYRLVWDVTTKQVLSLTADPVGTLWPPKGQAQMTGSLDACHTFIARHGLTPLPDPALPAAKTAKLVVLAAALNLALTETFQGAPIQAQITFSNLAGEGGSITRLVNAGQLALAEAALQGMITDQLVPPDYSAFIDPAVEAIVAMQPRFAAVQSATTIAAVEAA